MKDDAPKVTTEDVERLVCVLRTATGWLTAAALAQALFGKESEQAKRRVRAIASAAGAGVVSYPGSPGYRLWTACTADEVQACFAAYRSQIDEMERRRDQYRARPHRECPVDFSGGPDPDLRPSREQLTLL